MLLLIAVAAIVGTGVLNLAILLGLTSWVAYGRVARAMALSLREREFVLSATTQGATAAWNIRKHLLPNVLPQMLIVGSYELGQIIVLEASLSYLGLGVQPPLPSWGLMVSEGQTYLELDPWLSVLPSIALFMLVAGVQILSQSLHRRERHVRRDREGAMMADVASSSPPPSASQSRCFRCAILSSRCPAETASSGWSTTFRSTCFRTRCSASSASPARAKA